jgi:UDP-N-acetylmuramoyl-tripeptide--D-alanyl-D-alanine ligase
MRLFLRKKLEWVLANLARWTVEKYEPSVIGITGSVGKTSTKEAVYAVLRDLRPCRATRGNLNNELGLPLTILGDYGDGGGAWFYFKVIIRAVWRLLLRADYPEILILEYGIQKPGDMKYLLDIARPSIGILTAVGPTPVHVEYFSNPESVAREKAKLLENVPAAGFSIINCDDDITRAATDKVRAHIMKFGFSADSDVRVTTFSNLATDSHPFGISFKLNYGGNFVPVRFPGIFGKSHAYASAAAACVGLIFGSNLVRIAESLTKYYQPARHRMALVPLRGGAFAIDDSYNASPMSMSAAFDAVAELEASRKIGVLGDMRELGKYAVAAHETAGESAGKVFDWLIVVGPLGKIIGESAVKIGGLDPKNLITAESAEEAAAALRDLLKPGDLVLIKASRAIGLDRVIDELRSE